MTKDSPIEFLWSSFLVIARKALPCLKLWVALLFQSLDMRSAQPAVKVSLRSFKEFVAKNFDDTTPLYKVLMCERDEVSRGEFAAKFDICLRLVNLSLPSDPRMAPEG